MKEKLFVFDLDSTLAEVGKPIKQTSLDCLKALQAKGRIAIASGKPIYYLTGLLRQIGLEEAILLGENGAIMQIGCDLPPKTRKTCDYDLLGLVEIEDVKEKVLSILPDIYLQPNEICFSPFPSNEEGFSIIEKILASSKLEHVDVFRHFDCFDIVPKGINKGNGAKMVLDYLGIDPTCLYAIGDEENDIPLFKVASHPYGIGDKVKDYVDASFSSIDDCLAYLLNHVK